MSTLYYLGLCVLVPAALAGKLCEQRHRNQAKGFIVTALAGFTGFGGWAMLFLLWLMLKRRNPTTQVLY